MNEQQTEEHTEQRAFRLGDVVYRSPFDSPGADPNLVIAGKILSAADPNDYAYAVGKVHECLMVIRLRRPPQTEKAVPFQWLDEAGPLFPSWLAVLEDGLRRLEELAKEVAVARAAISAASIGLLSEEMK